MSCGLLSTTRSASSNQPVAKIFECVLGAMCDPPKLCDLIEAERLQPDALSAMVDPGRRGQSSCRRVSRHHRVRQSANSRKHRSVEGGQHGPSRWRRRDLVLSSFERGLCRQRHPGSGVLPEGRRATRMMTGRIMVKRKGAMWIRMRPSLVCATTRPQSQTAETPIETPATNAQVQRPATTKIRHFMEIDTRLVLSGSCSSR